MKTVLAVLLFVGAAAAQSIRVTAMGWEKVPVGPRAESCYAAGAGRVNCEESRGTILREEVWGTDQYSYILECRDGGVLGRVLGHRCVPLAPGEVFDVDVNGGQMIIAIVHPKTHRAATFRYAIVRREPIQYH